MKKILVGIKKHGEAFWNSIRRLFGAPQTDLPFERIIFVVGINTSESRAQPFVRFLEKNFPEKEVIVVQEYYFHSQHDKVEHLIEETSVALSAGKKTLVIGHSFGGLIALAAMGRVTDCRNVVLLATLASPHSMEEFGVRDARERHAIAEKCHVPILTFGGLLDAVVPDEFTHCEDEIGHISLSATHIGFLHSRRTRKEMLQALVQYFNLQT